MDEDLPDFFKTIRLSQAKELVAEQDNMRHIYGFIHNDPDTTEALETLDFSRNPMQGTPWYQILSNVRYSN